MALLLLLIKQMRFFYLIILIFSSNMAWSETTTSGSTTDIQPAPNPSCQYFRDFPKIDYKDGRLSDFWADELTGKDIVENERVEHQSSLHQFDSYVCDTPDDGHWNHVLSIYNGENNINPGRKVDCDAYDDLLRFLKRQKIFSQNIIVNSMSYSRMSLADKERAALLAEKSVFLVAAGNNYNKGETRVEDYEALVARHGSLLIGAMDAKGMPASYSQESTGVNILAPVDFSKYTYVENGTAKFFGGTSSAAPQVGYAFKAVREWLPEITREQLKDLVRKTATPLHSTYQRPQRNGAGLLNTYQMWEVAKRIAQKCRGQLMPHCMNEELRNFRQFTIDSSDIIAESDQAFPSCKSFADNTGRFSLTKPDSNSQLCIDQKRVLLKLRKRFLLNPTDERLRRRLACAYFKSDLGESGNLVLDSIGVDRGKNIIMFGNWAPKTLEFLPADQRPGYIEKHITKGNDYTKKMVIMEAFKYGIPGVEVLFKNKNSWPESYNLPRIRVLQFRSDVEDDEKLAQFLIQHRDVWSQLNIAHFHRMVADVAVSVGGFAGQTLIKALEPTYSFSPEDIEEHLLLIRSE